MNFKKINDVKKNYFPPSAFLFFAWIISMVLSHLLGNNILKALSTLFITMCMTLVIHWISNIINDSIIRSLVKYEVIVLSILVLFLGALKIYDVAKHPLPPDNGAKIMAIFFILLYLLIFPILFVVGRVEEYIENLFKTKNIFKVNTIKIIVLLSVFAGLVWFISDFSSAFTMQSSIDSICNSFDLTSFTTELDPLKKVAFMAQFLATKIIELVLLGTVASIFTNFNKLKME